MFHPELDSVRLAQDVIRRHAGRWLPCPNASCRALGGRLVLKRGRGKWFWGCTMWDQCWQKLAADQVTGDPIQPEIHPAPQQAPSVRFERVRAPYIRDTFTETDPDEFFLDGLEDVERERQPRPRKKRTRTPKPSVSVDFTAPVKRRIVLEK